MDLSTHGMAVLTRGVRRVYLNGGLINVGVKYIFIITIKDIVGEERVKADGWLTEWDRTRKKSHRARVISKFRVFSERCEVLQCLKSPKPCWHKTSAEIAGQFREAARWAPLLYTVVAAIRLKCNICHSCMQFGCYPRCLTVHFHHGKQCRSQTPLSEQIYRALQITPAASFKPNRRLIMQIDGCYSLACAHAEKQWLFPWPWKQCNGFVTAIAHSQLSLLMLAR